jgi:lipopolysaccharide biosynthesis glycosyltransferase
LNIVLEGKISRLPIGFNLETSLQSRLSDEAIADHARIIHFSGPWKPWSNYSFSPFFADWDKNYQEVFGQPFNRKALLPSRRKRLNNAFISRLKGLILGR